jgi:hypothetical protein
MAELNEDGQPVDEYLLCDLLQAKGELDSMGGPPFISGLLDGCVPENAHAYAERIRKAAAQRRLLDALEMAKSKVQDGESLEKVMAWLTPHTETPEAHYGRIRCFEDVPDILAMQIPQLEYIVPALGIARNTITLWTGADGDAKTYLAQAMSIAVGYGRDFLGMRCQKTPVLYVDLENPAYVVQERLQIMTNNETVSQVRFWGIWNEQQPPQCGSEPLLRIARETQPLIIIDPFRYFHNAKENDSDEMSAVMKYLRACAACGSAVVILHHPAKSVGSTGRGSSAIRGASDLAFLHSLDKERKLIRIKVDKNRHGESREIAVRADFEEGRFELVDAPYITRRNDELSRIEDAIKANPGLTQNALWKKTGGMKSRFHRLIKEGIGTRWREDKEGSSLKYYPCTAVLCSENNREQQNRSDGSCSTVLSPLGENRE